MVNAAIRSCSEAFRLITNRSTGITGMEGLEVFDFYSLGYLSELAGVWEVKNISRGLSEQIQAHAGIYSDTYPEVAKRFNTVQWNADSIALMTPNLYMRLE